MANVLVVDDSPKELYRLKSHTGKKRLQRHYR